MESRPVDIATVPLRVMPESLIAPLAPASATALIPVAQKNTAIVRAQTQRAIGQLDKVERTGAAAVERYENDLLTKVTGVGAVLTIPWSAFGGGMAAVSLPMSAVAAVYGLVAASPEALEAAGTMALLGGNCAGMAAVLLGPVIGARTLARHIAKGQFAAAAGGDVAALVKESKPATGLARAWIGVRSEAVLKALDVTSASTSVAARPGWMTRVITRVTSIGCAPALGDSRALLPLREAASLDGIAEEDIVMARRMEAVHALVAKFAEQKTKVAETIVINMPGLLHQLESLSPEARALLAPAVRDNVLLALGDAPAYAHVAQRFIDAFDGKRTPYEGPELSVQNDLGVTLDELKSRAADTREPAVAAARKVEAMIHACITGNTPIDVHGKLDDATAAETVAAHFERAGYRAIIAGQGPTWTVRVYDPETPPTGFRVL